MENNKKYNTSKAVRFSMLMGMLVLGSLFRPILSVSDEVLSYRDGGDKVYHYFTDIPQTEAFSSWKEKVVQTVADYSLAPYLTNWLADIDKLEKIIVSVNKKGKSKMSFEALIAQHQVKVQSNSSMICGYAPQPLLDDQSGKLVNIGKLSSGGRICINPVVAVIDELYRESMRNWRFPPNAKTKRMYNLCFEISKKELGQYAKIVQTLNSNPLTALASAASSLLGILTGNTAQPGKDSKND